MLSSFQYSDGPPLSWVLIQPSLHPVRGLGLKSPSTPLLVVPFQVCIWTPALYSHAPRSARYLLWIGPFSRPAPAYVDTDRRRLMHTSHVFSHARTKTNRKSACPRWTSISIIPKIEVCDSTRQRFHYHVKPLLSKLSNFNKPIQFSWIFLGCFKQ